MAPVLNQRGKFVFFIIQETISSADSWQPVGLSMLLGASFYPIFFEHVQQIYSPEIL